MKKQFIILIAVVLAIAAVTQAYLLYKKGSFGGFFVGKDKETKEIVWKNVLEFPGPDATQEAKQAHFVLADKSAVSTDEVDITGCKANPAVVRMGENNELKIRNSDDVAHTLLVSSDEKYSVGANTVETVKFSLTKGPGLYGYDCDDSHLVGLFLTSKPDLQ